MAKGTDIEAWHVEFQQVLDNEDALVNRRPAVSSGHIKCRKCKSNNLTTTQVQTRGADESMTVFFECGDCGQRWKC